MKTWTILGMIVIVVLIAGCSAKPNTAPNVTLQGAVISSGNSTVVLNQTQMQNANATKIVENKTSPKVPETQGKEFKNASFTVTGVEGDLITLKPTAVDPDGDKITYTYSALFNKNGLWQTKDGDTGKYLVTVTANDGKSTSSIDVVVDIKPSNKAPIIDCPEDIRLKEGDTVNINCNFFDKENDALNIGYSGWMTGTKYATDYEDQGDHSVFVSVSDGFHNISKTIHVLVENVDRAPVFNTHLKDMNVVETDIVTLKPNVSDPDNDKLTITYSTPLDKNGVWKTKIDDAGNYPITVVVSDGTLTTKETFTLKVKMLNTAPVMKNIANITVDEGDTIRIAPDVADRENDPITITYAGWMKTASYTTTYDDAYPRGCNTPGCSASYKVVVTVSDGVYTDSQDVYVTVTDKNRAPIFVLP